jgi:myo-inositol-1(or 4)-monophosphatase
MNSSDKLLDCAIDAATAAGRHAFCNMARNKEVIQETSHDVKLKLDVECQQIASETIASAFPEHSFLGEEGPEASEPAYSEYLWVVDPIDGTVNFSHGFPFWCNSVAVLDRDGNTVAGAVYAPEMDELFTASVNRESRLNGERIKVSETARLSKAMILTGFDRNVSEALPPMSFLQAIESASRKVRAAGAAALDLCRVAAGQSDGYFEAGIFTWDIAAGALVVEQAGGRTDLLKKLRDHPHRKAFMASNGVIHEELKAVLQDVLAPIQD